MRIQHNIPAMNSYRNYANNTSAVSKNLEKLSSGYKINRAGDDAAGLAISQKMRIQITGLEQAQSNAKAGINLVQTAEGALTEVHDMLERMYTLAEQSANGTYDNTTDRAQLQKEVSSLRTEIDRIADSSNYNGIKLLDGSLEAGGATAVDVMGKVKVTSSAGGASTCAVATGDGFKTDDLTGLGAGEKLQINLTDDKGRAYSVTLARKDTQLVDEATGKTYDIPSGSTADADAKAIFESAIASATSGSYKATVTTTDGSATIKSEAKGAGAGTIISVGVNKIAADGSKTAKATGALTTTKPTAGSKTLESVTAVTSSDSSDTAKSAIFTVNGQKFALTTETSTEGLNAVKAALGEDVKVLQGATLDKAAGQLAQATGLTVDGTTANKLTISAGSGKALSMQIGDTAESFNRMDVNVRDCHSSAMGIGGIDISNQSDAAAAMTAIKSATNYVSDVRGTLGALQNRLDHTINNLSVSQENIQDAESTIRDTDVAKEMMAYTKNSILVQSAQAMLAQANQLPQGVLQLLG